MEPTLDLTWTCPDWIATLSPTGDIGWQDSNRPSQCTLQAQSHSHRIRYPLILSVLEEEEEAQKQREADRSK